MVKVFSFVEILIVLCFQIKIIKKAFENSSAYHKIGHTYHKWYAHHSLRTYNLKDILSQK